MAVALRNKRGFGGHFQVMEMVDACGGYMDKNCQAEHLKFIHFMDIC